MARFDPVARMVGGYSKYDGTVEFYGRIRALLRPEFTVLDLGAGRGWWNFDDPSAYRKSQRHIKDSVARLIGCDVDPAVLENTSTHENRLMEGNRVPVEDGSIDVVIADYVLEHITDVPAFYAETDRVLKPGGYFCARTPHALNYVAVAARFIKNRSHARVLKTVQPGRKEIDVFPTAYRLNTLGAVRHAWRAERWEDYSYVYVAEPEYFLGSKPVYHALSFLHRVLPVSLTGNLFAFFRKKTLQGSSSEKKALNAPSSSEAGQ